MRMMRGVITLDHLQNYVFCFLDIFVLADLWPEALA